MNDSIPLIRASNAAPVEHALRATGRYREATFLQAGLPASPLAEPNRLVSFHAYLNLLDQLSNSEGADFACRSTTPETLKLLGSPWASIRSSKTVYEAIRNLAETAHLQASHAFFSMKDVPGGSVVIGRFPTNMTASAEHTGYQQIAGMVSALGRVINGVPLEATIRLPPHPELGVEHLKPYLGPDVQPCIEPQLSVMVPNSALDMVFPWEPVQFEPVGSSLTAATSANLSESARLLLEGMLRDGQPNLDALALAAGRSRRTMQRLLMAEGTCFANLIDSIRHDMAMADLQGTRLSVSAIAHSLGYSNTSSLTRAVRRWADTPPSRVRSRAGIHGSQ